MTEAMRRPLPSRRRLSGESGFTLVEVLAASLILMVGLLGTVKLIDGANAQTVVNQGREAGTNLARTIVEASGQLPYGELTPASVAPALRALPELAGTGGGWTLERRGFTYTVSVTACTIDDRADGYGATHDASYCADSPQTDAGAATQDRDPDDLRRVTATVSWTHRGNTRSVRQAALVPNPGNAVGPAVVRLEHPSWDAAPGSDPSEIRFEAQVAPVAARVTFAVDGAPPIEGVRASDDTWTWTWTGLRSPDGSTLGGRADGTTLVSAQAYDADGRSRGANVIAVRLNRRLATPPASFSGGRNLRLASTEPGSTVVDLEWTPSPEPDVVGYRVYRNVTPSLSGASVACTRGLTDPVDRRYSCTDRNAPAGSPLSYGIVALDPDPADDGRTRESAVRWLTVASGNTAPNPPRNLKLVVDNATGSAKLSWDTPAADADGDATRYFRIYRGSGTGTFTSLADRFDRTGAGTTLVWTDAEYVSPPYTYYVTTVDARHGESTPAGPVTG